MLATEAAIASGRRRDFAAVAAALWANGMTTLNYGVAGFVLVPLHALVRLRALRAHPARVVGLAVALLVATVALVPVLWPYLLLSWRGVLPPAKPGGRNFAIEFLPHLLGAYGIPPVALGVLAVGAAVSLFARPRARHSGWALGIAFVLLGCILVLGREVRVPGTEVMIPLPLALLERLIPALETLRVPMRFIMVTGLGLALLLGLAVDRLLGLVTGRARVVAAAVVVAVIGAELVWRRAPFDVVPVPIGASTPPVYTYLRQHGAGRPLLEVPVGGRRDATRQANAVFFSINHWLPLLNGFASHRPPGWAHLAAIITRLPDPAALQQLVNVVDVGWIVVHEEDMPIWWRRRAWGPSPPGLRQVARFDGDVLYEVLLRPTEDPPRAVPPLVRRPAARAVSAAARRGARGLAAERDRVHLGGHDEVVLVQALDLVRVEDDFGVAPAEGDVGVVPLGLGDVADAPDERHRAREVREGEAAGDARRALVEGPAGRLRE